MVGGAILLYATLLYHGGGTVAYVGARVLTGTPKVSPLGGDE